ncbi:MAG: 30S ribosomal protein S6 [Lentisphaerae bacterium]|nr:30S ribosomal protein S6 [Lentisphaerota bacterium]
MRRYEALFIFEKSLGDEPLEKAVEQAKSEVTRLGGSVLDLDVLGKRTFARPMQKRESGVYAKILFELEEDQVEPFQARFKHNEDVFRVQVVRARESEPVETEEKPAEAEPKQEE